LRICYPGDSHERSASNRSKTDFIHGVSSLVDRQECRQISMRPFNLRSVKFFSRRVFAGTWLGLKLFGRIGEAMFRKVVLALLFISGAALAL